MPKHQFIKNLNNYLIARYGSNNLTRLNDDTHTMLAVSKKFELYLRFSLPEDRKHSIWDQTTLVIARIGFKDQRVGNGKSLLQFLVSQSKLFNYTKIGLEMTNKNASNFARKFSFTQITEKNWVINIKDLEV